MVTDDTPLARAIALLAEAERLIASIRRYHVTGAIGWEMVFVIDDREAALRLGVAIEAFRKETGGAGAGSTGHAAR